MDAETLERVDLDIDLDKDVMCEYACPHPGVCDQPARWACHVKCCTRIKLHCTDCMVKMKKIILDGDIPGTNYVHKPCGTEHLAPGNWYWLPL